MLRLIRRLALPIAITSLAVNVVITVVSCALWALAAANGWLASVTFVSNVSMLALLFAGISGLAAAVAGILALVPTDDLLSGSGEGVPAERDREEREAESDQLDRERPARDEEGGDEPEDDRSEEEDALEGRIHR